MSIFFAVIETLRTVPVGPETHISCMKLAPSFFFCVASTQYAVGTSDYMDFFSIIHQKDAQSFLK